MTQSKIHFLCQECGETYPKWQGQCSSCKEWNSIKEFKIPKLSSASKTGSATRINLTTENFPRKIENINISKYPRILTGIEEFDRVLGGGIVKSSVTLIGGAPGIGKSSILLQVLAILSLQYKCIYISGEESLEQVAERAKRMRVKHNKLFLMASTSIEEICSYSEKEQPQFLVIDSIQTMGLYSVNSAATGSLSQVRDSANYITQYAKKNGVSIFLVGHITKSGEVAGPKVLEHMVDTVIYLEGDGNNKYRTMRSVKNRYGNINELGVFIMLETGLKQVKNPSAIFLNRNDEAVPGSVVMVIWEGTRPMLVEIQAIASDTIGTSLKRVSLGLDSNRLSMLLAVLSKHIGLNLANKDIYLNVVGGIKISETGADLASLTAIFSSFHNLIIAKELIIFGEVGLAGEVRPIPNGVERIKEANKHGFNLAIVPVKNVPLDKISYRGKEIKVFGVKNLNEALIQLEQLCK